MDWYKRDDPDDFFPRRKCDKSKHFTIAACSQIRIRGVFRNDNVLSLKGGLVPSKHICLSNSDINQPIINLGLRTFPVYIYNWLESPSQRQTRVSGIYKFGRR